MIRGKSNSCPFGLPITDGCKVAGGTIGGSGKSAIMEMHPLEASESKEEAAEIADNNLEIMLMVEEHSRCPFADMVFEEKESVDCKYDPKQSTIPAGNVGLNGSPLYPHIMIGNMPEAQYGYPLDYYSDNNESRNVYYGIYSLVG
jgi:hypothetical protein